VQAHDELIKQSLRRGRLTVAVLVLHDPADLHALLVAISGGGGPACVHLTVVWADVGHELRDQACAVWLALHRQTGHNIRQIVALHQSNKDVMEFRRVAELLRPRRIVPQLAEPGKAHQPVRVARLLVIEHEAHRRGQPVGLEHHDVAQRRVVLVVNQMPEPVRHCHEEPRLFRVHFQPLAERQHFIQREVGRAVCLQCFPRFLPALRHRAAHFRQARGHAGDGIAEFRDAGALAILVRFAVHEEEVNHRLLAEEVPEILPVDVRLACARTAVRGYHEDSGLRLAVLH